MTTWPAWKFSSQPYCEECRTVYSYTGSSDVSCGCYCPVCHPGQKMVIHTGAFRWICTAVWWKPWTWGTGWWQSKLNGEAYHHGPQ